MFRLSLSKFGTLTRCLNVIGPQTAFVRKPVRTTKFFRHAAVVQAPQFRLPLNLGPGNHKVLVGLAIGCILGDFLVASPLIEVWERFRKSP